MVDFSFIVSLYVSDLPNVNNSTKRTFGPACLDFLITNAICSSRPASRPSVAVPSVRLSGFRGLPQDVVVPSRFRRRESVEKISRYMLGQKKSVCESSYEYRTAKSCNSTVPYLTVRLLYWKNRTSTVRPAYVLPDPSLPAGPGSSHLSSPEPAAECVQFLAPGWAASPHHANSRQIDGSDAPAWRFRSSPPSEAHFCKRYEYRTACITSATFLPCTVFTLQSLGLKAVTG